MTDFDFTKPYRVEGTFTTITYVYCNIAAKMAFKRAAELKAPASGGSLYFAMMAITFSAFTVEAFLNHLGQNRVPAWEYIERPLGPAEKLEVVRATLGLDVDKGKRPFQSLREMMQLRNALAHGKTEPRGLDALAVQAPSPAWEKTCHDLEKVRRIVEDSEGIVRNLHAQAGLHGEPFTSLGIGWVGFSEA
jgi:hypothetical protein